jgi:uncharacterized protein YdhG (YjbR/CyaY superfamily)
MRRPVTILRVPKGGVVAKANVGAVDAYIARHPPEVQAVLQRVRQIIGHALPGAEEAIGYGIPVFKQGSRSVVYFAGWKRHWSIYPATERIRAALGPALERYEISKGTIRFPLEDPVPVRLIQRLVKVLAADAAAREPRTATRGTKRASGG